MYQLNEFPTIIYCEENPSITLLDNFILDKHYNFKKLIYTNMNDFQHFINQLDNNQQSWQGQYLVYLPIKYCYENINITNNSVSIIPFLSLHEMTSEQILWKFLEPDLTLEVQFNLLNLNLDDIIGFIRRVPSQINILLQPDFDAAPTRIPDFISKLNELHSLAAEKNNIYYPENIFHRNVLLNHPCNIYACSGTSCHTKKSAYPRKIYIHSNGAVTPETPKLLKKYIIYNINKPPSKSSMFNKRTLEDFIKDMIWLFENFVIENTYEIIPVNVLIPYIDTLKEIID